MTFFTILICKETLKKRKPFSRKEPLVGSTIRKVFQETHTPTFVDLRAPDYDRDGDRRDNGLLELEGHNVKGLNVLPRLILTVGVS